MFLLIYLMEQHVHLNSHKLEFMFQNAVLSNSSLFPLVWIPLLGSSSSLMWPQQQRSKAVLWVSNCYWWPHWDNVVLGGQALVRSWFKTGSALYSLGPHFLIWMEIIEIIFPQDCCPFRIIRVQEISAVITILCQEISAILTILCYSGNM